MWRSAAGTLHYTELDYKPFTSFLKHSLHEITQLREMLRSVACKQHLRHKKPGAISVLFSRGCTSGDDIIVTLQKVSKLEKNSFLQLWDINTEWSLAG